MFPAFKPLSPRFEQTTFQIERSRSDSALSVSSPRNLSDRSQSFGIQRPLEFDLQDFLARMTKIQQSALHPKWDLQSTWLNSIWAVKPRFLRTATSHSINEDPIATAFQNDATSQKWLCLIRGIFLYCHSAQWISTGLSRGRYQMGFSSFEKKEIAHLYPSFIPLFVKTPCDRICSQKLKAKICDFFERLTFSAEGWMEVRSDLSHNERCFMMSWLLKIKMCNLLRDLQEQIDKNPKNRDLDDLFKRHFRSIPDLRNQIYKPHPWKEPSNRYCKLNAVLRAFCSYYRKNRSVQIEQLQEPIEDYICCVYENI